MIPRKGAPSRARARGDTIMNHALRKSKSVILYGSSIALGLVLCKAWFIAHAIV